MITNVLLKAKTQITSGTDHSGRASSGQVGHFKINVVGDSSEDIIPSLIASARG